MASSSSAPDPQVDSIFRFLVTTDNHLGFLERDPIRGEDSFTTFEEVLKYADNYQVDAMLLGGDFFHDNKPSLGCFTRVISLLRKYTFGSKPISFELLSNPAINFPTHGVPLANFQDPNVNIAIPIFSIHGNHDDPVGGTSALDVLANNSCLNYFGVTESVESIQLSPILLRKGHTFLALYGLGHVRDERLWRCFEQGKVKLIPPPPIEGEASSSTWFRLLVLHQNRQLRPHPLSKGGAMEDKSSRNQSRLEKHLKDFELDLVIWGNEHMQKMNPEGAFGFEVIQPGSTIRTALQAQTESPEKQCGLLEIQRSTYRLQPIPLLSVRPFISGKLELSRSYPDSRSVEAVEGAIRETINRMIKEVEEKQLIKISDEIRCFHPSLKLPLVKLDVDFNDANFDEFPMPNFYRLGQLYREVVANPNDMVRALTAPRSYASLTSSAHAASDSIPVEVSTSTLPHDIFTNLSQVLHSVPAYRLEMLSEVAITRALSAYVEKDERQALEDCKKDLCNECTVFVHRKMQQEKREASGSEEGVEAIYRRWEKYVVDAARENKDRVNKKFSDCVLVNESVEHPMLSEAGKSGKEKRCIDGENEFLAMGLPLNEEQASSDFSDNFKARGVLDNVGLKRVRSLTVGSEISDSGKNDQEEAFLNFEGDSAFGSVMGLKEIATKKPAKNRRKAAPRKPRNETSIIPKLPLAAPDELL